MKIASIDLGTNTFLCLIANLEGQNLQVISDQAQVVRLGEKVNQNGFFLPQALQRARSCLEKFKKIIDEVGVDKIIATATSAARDVKNGQELFDICKKLKIPMHIIEGSREARLSFVGALSAYPNFLNKKVLVVDIGGGSTEFIYKEPGEDLVAQSYDVGCVRLTEMFFEDYESMKSFSWNVIRSFGAVRPDILIAVAGTPTTLACMKQEINFDESRVEGFELTKESVEGLLFKLQKMTLEDKKQIKGLDPMRADVITAGAVLLKQSLDLVGLSKLIVSTRGLRFGTVINHEEFL